MGLQQTLIATPTPVGWNRILTPFGVSIQPNLVYDLASYEIVQARGALYPYPFGVRALANPEAVPTRGIESVTFRWVSSIAVTDSAAVDMVTPLFTTTEMAGVESGQPFVSPERDYDQEGLEVHVLGVMVNPLASDSANVSGRVIVVGNSDFLMDGAIQTHGPAGLRFALNAVDWLAQDDALIAIRTKNREPPPLAFESEGVRDFVKWGNIIGVPLLLVMFGAFRLVRRRRRMGRTYSPVARSAS
jgi:ABC-type uncharacterized transport system involved in gliding motility auxiliary subunit